MVVLSNSMTSLFKSKEPPGKSIRYKQKTVSGFLVFIIIFTGLVKQFTFLSLIDFNYIPIEELVQPESNHTIKESPAGITNVTDPVSEKGLAYNASSIMNGVHPLLTCSEIRNLEIIRRIGNGERKAAYMVKLPSGKHALAKRCINEVCIRDQSVAKEASFFMELQNQYGSEAVQFYGECNSSLPYPLLALHDRRGFDKAASNFSLGYTSVVELGKPLITTWMKIYIKKNFEKFFFQDRRKCFARYFTDADLEGFKFIARQYANMSSSPKLLGPKKGYIDNIFAEQYILTKAGLRLGDLDSYETCKECSYEKAVKHNCKIVSRVVFKDLECSLANSLKNPVKFPDDHINVTEANINCIDGWQKDMNKK